MIKEQSEQQKDSATLLYNHAKTKLVGGMSVAKDYLGWGLRYIYNLPQAGNAQRKGVDYERALKTKNKSDRANNKKT